MNARIRYNLIMGDYQLWESVALRHDQNRMITPEDGSQKIVRIQRRYFQKNTIEEG